MRVCVALLFFYFCCPFTVIVISCGEIQVKLRTVDENVGVSEFSLHGVFCVEIKRNFCFTRLKHDSKDWNSHRK